MKTPTKKLKTIDEYFGRPEGTVQQFVKEYEEKMEQEEKELVERIRKYLENKRKN